MFKPSAAPRWKSTTSCFLFDTGVAAMARRKNAGIVLKPTMATPPLFRNIRRETFIVVLLPVLPRASARSNTHSLLAPLEFRRAQNQTSHHTYIDLFHGIIQPCAENLRIVQLLFKNFARLLRNL